MSDPIEEVLRRLDAMEKSQAARFDAIEHKQDRLWDIVVVSTVEGGSVVDVLRKHDAQIHDLQGSTWVAFCTRHAMGTLITLFITFLAAVFGRGLIVSIIAEAQKVAGR